MRNILIVLFSLGITVAQAQIADPTAIQRAADLQQAIRSHSYEALRPSLTDSCTVQGYRGDMAEKVFTAFALQKFSPLDTLYVTAVSPTDTQTEVTATMKVGQKTIPCSFALNPKGQFTQITLAANMKVSKQQTTVTSLHREPVCELPFELKKGFIILRTGIAMNGMSGVFVLDTGCKSLVFNSTSTAVSRLVAGSGVLKRTGVSSSQSSQMQVVKVDSLAIGGNLFSATCPATDLTALAHDIGLEELTGLLGAELLRGFETHIDYARKRLTLYRLEADGTAPNAPTPKQRLGFELLAGYLPLFAPTVGGSPLRMVFDSGAQECCLTPACADSLGKSFHQQSTSQLSDGFSSVEVRKGRIDRIEWSRIHKRKIQAVVRDLTSIGDIDGILGYPIVEGRHISLNYAKQELGIY